MLFTIDERTPFGKRVARRLQEERIIWLTTVSQAGEPNPRPVWFLWDGNDIIIYSRPGTYKLKHIRNNPNVSLSFDGDGMGGDIVIIAGRAHIDQDVQPADQVSAYINKYTEGLQRINMTPQEFAQEYSVALRIEPHRIRGH